MTTRAFLFSFLIAIAAQAQNPAQQRFMDLKYGMFIHFGINTFNDKEWSYGDLPLESFTAKTIDTDQWCSVAKAAGIKYIIFTAKHVDGFCNWHTGQTGYAVQNTSYQKDIIKQLAQSCKKYDLKLGLYYCLWDAHHPDHRRNEPAYNAYVRKQVQELLTGYGEIVCLWFDGFWKNQQSGWLKQDALIDGYKPELARKVARDEIFIDAWRREGAFRLEWDQLYIMIKSIQPDCMVFNNPTTAYRGVPLLPVDARPAEKGHHMDTDRKYWQWLGDSTYLPLEIETTLSQKGDELFPSGNWFWHEWDHSVATREQVLEWARAAQRLDANLVLNVGPMRNGQLRPEDIALLTSISLQ